MTLVHVASVLYVEALEALDSSKYILNVFGASAETEREPYSKISFLGIAEKK
jgi:hypothetical protein